MAEGDTLPPGVDPELEPEVRLALAYERFTVALRDLEKRIELQDVVTREYADLGARMTKLSERGQGLLYRLLEHRVIGVVIVTAAALTILHLVGVDVDVNQLADSLAHWRTGQPHQVECYDNPAPVELP